MLIAPHPDDEALACSVILQQAVRAGAAIRVVYVTDGDNNPWPQRALERRWRLSASDRKRWGKLRRAEALAALRVLGIHPADVQFLALPDQGLTDLLLRDCDSSTHANHSSDRRLVTHRHPCAFALRHSPRPQRRCRDDAAHLRRLFGAWSFAVELFGARPQPRVLRQRRGIIILRIRDRQKTRSNLLPSNANQTVEATFS